MKMGKFIIREKNEKYSFRLKAGNGEVIATSQLYKSLQTCKAGIASVAQNAPIAALEDQTVEGKERPEYRRVRGLQGASELSERH